jgi:hypothetical protein
MRGFSGDFDTQIQNAREELTNIAKNLSSAEDKKRDFYLTLLLQFKDRLTVLARPDNPQEKKALTDFLEEFSSVLRQAPLS